MMDRNFYIRYSPLPVKSVCYICILSKCYVDSRCNKLILFESDKLICCKVSFLSFKKIKVSVGFHQVQ